MKKHHPSLTHMPGIRPIILFIVFQLACPRIFSQENAAVGSTLSLQQCVDISIKNNLLVSQSNLQMQAGSVYLTQAKANFLPMINAAASQGMNEGRSINPYTNQYIDEKISTGNYSLNGNLVLFNGLQYQNLLRQQQYNYDASKLDWQQQKDNITLNILLAYLQVLSNQDLLKIAREQADVDAKQVERLELLNREGAIPPATLYDLKGQLANDQVNIINQVNAVETAKINLFQLMNVPYKKDVQFEKIAIDAALNMYGSSSDSIYQTALVTMPMIQSVDLKTKAFERALRAARGQYFPTLSLYGGISSYYSSAANNTLYGPMTDYKTTDYITYNGTQYFVTAQQPSSVTLQKIPFSDQFKNNLYTSFGLQLQIPILNAFRARNNVKLAKLNLQNEKLIAGSTRIQLQQNIELAYQNMIAAYGQYKTYQQQVEAYAASFRAAEIKFNNGVITAVDYVIAKNNIDRANTNLTAAKYNYIFRTKILDYYQGTLSW